MRTVPERPSRRLQIATLAAVLLITIAGVSYTAGAGQYVQYLQQGTLGAWCLGCSSGSTALTVVPHSPADRSGIRSGDEVLAVDGVPVDPQDFPATRMDVVLSEGIPGEVVEVTVRSVQGVTAVHRVERARGWNDILTTGMRILGFGERAAFLLAVAVEFLLLVGFAGTGLYIWRSRRGWLAFLTGVTLILLVFPTTRSPLFLELGPARTIFFSIPLILFYILFYLLPAGRLFPRWSPVVIALYALWLVVNSVWIRPVLGGFDYSRLLDIVFWGIALRAQFVRYHRMATPEERQQIKWVLTGFFVAVIERSLFLSMIFLVPPLMFQVSSTVLSHLFVSFGDIASRLLYLVIPLTFLVSIFRYGLWEIDYVLNRSLVYGFLTLALGAVFAGTLYIVQGLLAGVLDDDQRLLASITAAGIAAVALFPRLQSRLRRFVDARLFGIQLNYRGAPLTRPPALFALGEVLPGELAELTDIYLVGKGGMGEVYCGYQPSQHRQVAIKILPDRFTHDPEAIRRFLQEAEIASQLKHPNIVQVLDYGQFEGYPYITMEMIHGVDLEMLLSEVGQLTLGQVCRIMQQVGLALDYSHEQGVVHRDIKPSNIMIETANRNRPLAGNFRCVLTDFGIAKFVNEANKLSATGFRGTFEYLAPEQITESDEMDWRVDVYAAGVVAYRLLTGQLPFENTNMARLLLAHIHKPPLPPRELHPDIPELVSAAVVRALAKQPAARFDSMASFVNAMCG